MTITIALISSMGAFLGAMFSVMLGPIFNKNVELKHMARKEIMALRIEAYKKALQLGKSFLLTHDFDGVSYPVIILIDDERKKTQQELIDFAPHYLWLDPDSLLFFEELKLIHMEIVNMLKESDADKDMLNLFKAHSGDYYRVAAGFVRSLHLGIMRIEDTKDFIRYFENTHTHEHLKAKVDVIETAKKLTKKTE